MGNTTATTTESTTATAAARSHSSSPSSQSGSGTAASPAAHEKPSKSAAASGSGKQAEAGASPRRTPLYDEHLQAGARMVDFGGWDMPLSYRSQIEEHQGVRDHAGLFDVSHMTVLDLTCADAAGSVRGFLRQLLANDIARISADGGALYTCMLNQQGGVIDDLIAYRISEDHFRLVVNASTRDKDLAWIESHMPGSVHLQLRDDLALLAIQGPAAIAGLSQAMSAGTATDAGSTPTTLAGRLESLKRFNSLEFDGCWIARTGYTGEDGVELAIDASRAPQLWRNLVAAGIPPVGLGARDTLRLEAGLNLYGNDMDESVSPLASGLAWTVSFADSERAFIGREALETELQQRLQQRHGPCLVGLKLVGKGVLRHGQKIYQGDEELGVITSGSFSPTLQGAIALARLRLPLDESGQPGNVLAASGDGTNADAAVNRSLCVDIRGRRLPVLQVSVPFYKRPNN